MGTELRTLKDFEIPDVAVEGAISKIRDEAIEWVKFYREMGLFGEAVGLGKFCNVKEEDLTPKSGGTN